MYTLAFYRFKVYLKLIKIYFCNFLKFEYNYWWTGFYHNVCDLCVYLLKLILVSTKLKLFENMLDTVLFVSFLILYTNIKWHNAKNSINRLTLFLLIYLTFPQLSVNFTIIYNISICFHFSFSLLRVYFFLFLNHQ